MRKRKACKQKKPYIAFLLGEAQELAAYALAGGLDGGCRNIMRQLALEHGVPAESIQCKLVVR